MTNLNEVEIVACKEAPKGEQQEITSIVTAATSPGQLIATVPGDQDQWAECTIEAVNTSSTTDYCIRLQWGQGDVASSTIIQLLSRYQGAQTVVDGRLLTGGMKVYASCLNATAAGAGAVSVLNVYVRPFLLHKK